MFFLQAAFVAFGLLPAARVHALNGYVPTPTPPVVAPKSGDVWTVGQAATVRWSHDNITLPDYNSSVYLGHFSEDDAQFRLWYGEPLAAGFPLSTKEVQVIVPEVPSAGNYFIMVNSPANRGEYFNISNPADPQGLGAQPSTLTLSTRTFSPTRSLPPASTVSQGASAPLGLSGTGGPSASLTSSGLSASAAAATSTAPSDSEASGPSATAPASTSDAGSASPSGTGTGAPSATPNGGMRLGGPGVGLALGSVFVMLFAI